MRAGVLLLAAATLLAGCGKPAPSVREQEARAVAGVAKLTGWSRLYASPLETVGAINQAGFGLSSPLDAKGAYRLDGHRQMLSNADAKAPNTANVTVSGPDPKSVGRVAYTLALTDPKAADVARTRFAGAIGDMLGRFGIAGTAPLTDAIRAGRSGPVEIAGALVDVTARADRIDVTFTRPAAKAGTNNTQG